MCVRVRSSIASECSSIDNMTTPLCVVAYVLARAYTYLSDMSDEHSIVPDSGKVSLFRGNLTRLSWRFGDGNNRAQMYPGPRRYFAAQVLSIRCAQ